MQRGTPSSRHSIDVLADAPHVVLVAALAVQIASLAASRGRLVLTHLAPGGRGCTPCRCRLQRHSCCLSSCTLLVLVVAAAAYGLLHIADARRGIFALFGHEFCKIQTLRASRRTAPLRLRPGGAAPAPRRPCGGRLRRDNLLPSPHSGADTCHIPIRRGGKGVNENRSGSGSPDPSCSAFSSV